jgi:serine/threonine-protein phosphatase 2A activator
MSAPLPVRDLSTRDFIRPVKEITTKPKLETFLNSSSYADFEGFLSRTSDAVVGKRISQVTHISDFLLRVLKMLDEMEALLQEFPPIAQPMRYGNKAFRDYGRVFAERVLGYLDNVFGDSLPKEGKVELSVYLIESIGNTTRIDYGTGHETNFVAFLYCLERLGFVSRDDYEALILKVFHRYIVVMQRIQKTYMLEPAGSHGVWSLDDYQFLPFFYGAAQLTKQEIISPKEVLNVDRVKELKDDYMYFAAIDFICQMKTGPFGEFSPILFDMAHVPFWYKLHRGLLKMYKDEVMKKFPIMQHFFFGSIIVFPK